MNREQRYQEDRQKGKLSPPHPFYREQLPVDTRDERGLYLVNDKGERVYENDPAFDKIFREARVVDRLYYDEPFAPGQCQVCGLDSEICLCNWTPGSGEGSDPSDTGAVQLTGDALRILAGGLPEPKPDEEEDDFDRLIEDNAKAAPNLGALFAAGIKAGVIQPTPHYHN